MEKKIAILTDSSSSIYQLENKYDNIFLIDIPCFIGDEVFTDFATNKDVLFYEALAKSTTIAKTSQPSVGETTKKYEEIRDLGYTDIIYIPISKELSGTYQNGFMSKDMVSGINIEVVDTQTTASILSGMCFEAARLAKEGKSVPEIVETILELKKKSTYFVTVNDLTSLVKNGRLSNAKSFIANVLRIKPVIQLTKEGKLVSVESVRTYKKAIVRMVEHVEKGFDPKTGILHVGHTGQQEALDFLLNIIEEKFPGAKPFVFPIPSTLVAHIGLNSIALGYINH